MPGFKTNGVLSQQAAGTVLADTGPLAALAMSAYIMLYTNEGEMTVEIAVRNAQDSADVFTPQRFRVSGNSSAQPINIPITLALNQRMVVRLVNESGGDVQASILW